MTVHLTPEQAAESVLDCFKRAAAGELELLDAGGEHERVRRLFGRLLEDQVLRCCVRLESAAAPAGGSGRFRFDPVSGPAGGGGVNLTTAERKLILDELIVAGMEYEQLLRSTPTCQPG